MNVRCSRGGRVFPYYTAVTVGWRPRIVTSVVGTTANTTTTTITTTVATLTIPATGTAPVVVVVRRRTTVMVVTSVVVIVMVMVMTAAPGPLELVGRAAQLPALKRRPVARGLAVVHRTVLTVAAWATTTVDRVPTTQPHAPWEKQLEE